MCQKVINNMLLALELLGQEWREDKQPQEILLNDDAVALIMKTRSLVADPHTGLTPQRIRGEAPTFVEQVQLAIMRDFEELPTNGADY